MPTVRPGIPLVAGAHSSFQAAASLVAVVGAGLGSTGWAREARLTDAPPVVALSPPVAVAGAGSAPAVGPRVTRVAYALPIHTSATTLAVLRAGRVGTGRSRVAREAGAAPVHTAPLVVAVVWAGRRLLAAGTGVARAALAAPVRALATLGAATATWAGWLGTGGATPACLAFAQAAGEVKGTMVRAQGAGVRLA